MLVFHVVLIAGMAFILATRWQRAGVSWNWKETALGGLVLAQIALYLRFFALPSRWPTRLSSWTVYFCVQFALWFTTWRLEPGYEWMVLAYLGQMFGVFPPRFSIPATVLVFLVAFPFHVGWDQLRTVSLGGWIGYFSIALACSALGLFLHKLATTSVERAQLIQELEAARKEVELARQRDAEVAALTERERLARELHDSLGHSLVTLSVQLEAAQRLCAIDPGRAGSVLEQMKQLVRSSMEELRRSLAGLRAPGLGDRPLRQSLEALCAETAQRTGLSIACQIAEPSDPLPPTVAEALWRTAQEALANIEKHAQAHRAKVSIVLENQNAGADKRSAEGQPASRNDGASAGGQFPCVVLTVIDDGLGLPPDAESRPGHYGLRGLRERIEGLGGEFILSGAARKGATLEARIPLLGVSLAEAKGPSASTPTLSPPSLQPMQPDSPT